MLEEGSIPKTNLPVETVLNEDTRGSRDLLWISTSDLRNARTKKMISSHVMRRALSERRTQSQMLMGLAERSKRINKAKQTKRIPNSENDNPTATLTAQELTDVEDFDVSLVSSLSCRRVILTCG